MTEILEIAPAPVNVQNIPKMPVSKRIRIFLVDDSRQFLGVATRFLQMQPSCEVVGSSDSVQTAFTQISITQPDVVIVDLVMPGMNGLEAARKLKAERASLRVIVVSLQEGEEYADGAEMSGADGFIPKGDFCEKLVPFIDTLFKYPA
jgi:DNA-binding NarL/FixJ family response regulator